MKNETKLLPKVKANLILGHGEDDGMIRGFIRAALAYAESYQHLPDGHYYKGALPHTTEQAVIMLSSHFYESRDGSTGGFFADGTNAAASAWQAVHRLLAMEKRWDV